MEDSMEEGRTKEKKDLLKVLKDFFDRLYDGRNMKKIFITSIIIASVISVITIMCGVYLNDYYRADGDEIGLFMEDKTHITSYRIDDGVTLFKGENMSDVGLIFYPGGKVEAEAYLPLMTLLAERGINAVLCEMPFNLAVLDVNAADGIAERLPEVKKWYIGGHSLGGSMAASYLDSHPELEGIILLGSYSTADIGDERALSIYGSKDGVMNRDKYEQYRPNLPKDLTEIVIEGGNHAYFGMYGEQDGDGKADITAIEQMTITADAIEDFINQ